MSWGKSKLADPGTYIVRLQGIFSRKIGRTACAINHEEVIVNGLSRMLNLFLETRYLLLEYYHSNMTTIFLIFSKSSATPTSFFMLKFYYIPQQCKQNRARKKSNLNFVMCYSSEIKPPW